MSVEVDRLIGMLEHTCFFQPGDIAALNDLLTKMCAEEIPERYRDDLVDIIDMMYMCGNVNATAGSRIDSLHTSLQNARRF